MLRPLPKTPSYKAYLNRRRHYWQARRRAQGDALVAEMQMLGRINKKILGYEWVSQCGIATPGYAVLDDIATALREWNHERFVIKPLGGHSSRGVYLLTRDGKGGYDCTMTGRHYAGDADVVAHFNHVRMRQPVADRITEKVIVETLIQDSFGFDVPLDYKVYAFATAAPMVMQRYAPIHLPKEQWAFEFYSRDGIALGPIRLETAGNRDGILKAPDGLEAIFQAAEHLVAAARVSFVRIDMYDTPDGPVFGEFTPVPNNAQEGFVAGYDTLLGEIWRDSLAALGMDYTRELGPRAAVGTKGKA